MPAGPFFKNCLKLIENKLYSKPLNYLLKWGFGVLGFWVLVEVLFCGFGGDGLCGVEVVRGDGLDWCDVIQLEEGGFLFRADLGKVLCRILLFHLKIYI